MIRFLVIFIVLQTLQIDGFVLQPRILNGFESDTSHFPFFVNVQYLSFMCGGSLINEKWIITAAHCLRRNVPINVLIGVGANGRFEKSIRLNATYQHIYPGYNREYKLYDIALIELPKPIKLSEQIQSIKLPANCNPIQGYEDVIAAGNGRTEMNTPASDKILRHGFSKAMSHDECTVALGDYPDAESVICAISLTEQNVHKGDSGGPLIRQKDGTLVGITSTSFAWEESTTDVQMFTKVSHFFDWISHKTGIELPKCEQQASIQL